MFDKIVIANRGVVRCIFCTPEDTPNLYSLLNNQRGTHVR